MIGVAPEKQADEEGRQGCADTLGTGSIIGSCRHNRIRSIGDCSIFRRANS
jgi:hypothetical protein